MKLVRYFTNPAPPSSEPQSDPKPVVQVQVRYKKREQYGGTPLRRANEPFYSGGASFAKEYEEAVEEMARKRLAGQPEEDDHCRCTIL
jgi:hypothetical protein